MKEDLQNNPENSDKKTETLSETTSITDEINNATITNYDAVRTHMLEDPSYFEAKVDLRTNTRNLDKSEWKYDHL